VREISAREQDIATNVIMTGARSPLASHPCAEMSRDAAPVENSELRKVNSGQTLSGGAPR
jgi:hypothetical protein